MRIDCVSLARRLAPFAEQMNLAVAVTALSLLIGFTYHARAQDAAKPATPSITIPPPMNIPAPAPQTDKPYAPQPILPGGIVIPLYSPDSKYLNKDKLTIPEKYSMSSAVPGRISSIVNIHNPSIEVHMVDRGINTGAVVILAAGGAHNTLNVGGESADFVPFFYNYGINTVILRNRLRSDGYSPQTDAVNDAMQAIRLVRKFAEQWRFNPNKIGIMGFSAGAELAAPAAIQFEEFDKANNDPSDPLAGVSSRPDFVGIIYPGPTPFTRNPEAAIPRNTPPAFITCAGAGDPQHALWATQYFSAMLAKRVPNVEMHIYGNGYHPGDRMPSGENSSGGLTDRNDTPYGTWQYRFIDWFRDLGFMQRNQELETKAALDIKAYMSRPAPTGARTGRGQRGRANTPAAPTSDGANRGGANANSPAAPGNAPGNANSGAANPAGGAANPAGSAANTSGN